MFQQGNHNGGSYHSMDHSGGGGGGGFLTDRFNSPTQGSQEKKHAETKVQSLVPVTIAVLKKAVYHESGDIFMLGEVPINQVTFVGVVKEIQEASTNIMYKIDDMTAGTINVRKWLDDGDKDGVNMRSQCRENCYVRVVGHLKLLQSTEPTVIAFHVTPITDFNEVTYHLIEVVHSHHILNKAKNKNENTNSPGGNMSFNKGMHTPGIDTSFGGGADLGLSRPQKLVHDAITACTGEHGMGTSDLRQKLRSLSDQEIRGAVEFLSNEGHIYSTIDDDHFKSTS